MTLDELIETRKARYRQAEGTHLRSDADALDFIEDLGFVWLIDLSEADLPSLQGAAPQPFLSDPYAKGSTVARSWWDTKQMLPARKACYYGKVLRGRGTFISWECFPLLYAVYASVNDYQDDYRDGILSRDEKRVLDLIAAHPEIPSPDLRRKFGSVGKDVTRALARALQHLQETFRITAAGGSIEGWTIHNWAPVGDWVAPEHLERARSLDPREAKKQLILRYLRMSVASSVGDIAWVFRWNRREVAGLVQELVQCDETREIEVLGIPGPMYTPG
jgi:hypothetical protein